jgi:hypothetical protein
MKIIIAGGRYFSDYDRLYKSCSKILEKILDIEIVSGTAKGADMLGERFSKDNGYKLKQFPADWDKFGKSAGYRRNAEMAKYADALIAFWDGNSRGTKNMIDLAEKANLKVRIIYFK